MAYKLPNIATPEKLLETINGIGASLEDSYQFLCATRTLLPFSLIITDNVLTGVNGNPTAVTLPNTLTGVSAKALKYTNIATITFDGATPPTFGADWSPSTLISIIVPSGAKTAYDTALPSMTSIISEASSGSSIVIDIAGVQPNYGMYEFIANGDTSLITNLNDGTFTNSTVLATINGVECEMAWEYGISTRDDEPSIISLRSIQTGTAEHKPIIIGDTTITDLTVSVIMDGENAGMCGGYAIFENTPTITEFTITDIVKHTNISMPWDTDIGTYTAFLDGVPNPNPKWSDGLSVSATINVADLTGADAQYNGNYSFSGTLTTSGTTLILNATDASGNTLYAEQQQYQGARISFTLQGTASQLATVTCTQLTGV